MNPGLPGTGIVGTPEQYANGVSVNWEPVPYCAACTPTGPPPASVAILVKPIAFLAYRYAGRVSIGVTPAAVMSGRAAIAGDAPVELLAAGQVLALGAVAGRVNLALVVAGVVRPVHVVIGTVNIAFVVAGEVLAGFILGDVPVIVSPAATMLEATTGCSAESSGCAAKWSLTVSGMAGSWAGLNGTFTMSYSGSGCLWASGSGSNFWKLTNTGLNWQLIGVASGPVQITYESSIGFVLAPFGSNTLPFFSQTGGSGSHPSSLTFAAA